MIGGKSGCNIPLSQNINDPSTNERHIALVIENNRLVTLSGFGYIHAATLQDQ